MDRTDKPNRSTLFEREPLPRRGPKTKPNPMREPAEAEPKGSVPAPAPGGQKSTRLAEKPRKIQASVKPERPAARRVRSR